MRSGKMYGRKDKNADMGEIKWISVKDKLPEKAGKYLVTMEAGGTRHTTARRFNPKPKHPQQNEPIFTKHLPLYSGWERRTVGVIAWAELPKPYED